jgi:hypothetical protein
VHVRWQASAVLLWLTGRRTPHPNPCPVRPEPVPTAEQVLAIAGRAGRLGGRSAYVMAVAGAFTGMRWGEITGLAKRKRQWATLTRHRPQP